MSNLRLTLADATGTWSLTARLDTDTVAEYLVAPSSTVLDDVLKALLYTYQAQELARE